MRGVLAAAGVGVLVAVVAAGQTPETGTITGHVKLTSRVHGTPLPSTVYLPRGINSRRPVSSIPEIKNVVVYLQGVTYAGVVPAMRAEIGQENEAFVPRVTAVTRGSSVTFPNNDPFFHNVFSLSSAATFNLGRYPKGKAPRALTFAKAGLVKVYCEIHSHMSASILVLDHPYFVVPERDGTFTIGHVPAGRHTIVGWHERVGERLQDIEVVSGQTATVELSLPVDDARDSR